MANSVFLDQKALYLTETPFNAFANRSDPDVRAALSGSSLFAYGNMIRYGPRRDKTTKQCSPQLQRLARILKFRL